MKPHTNASSCGVQITLCILMLFPMGNVYADESLSLAEIYPASSYLITCSENDVVCDIAEAPKAAVVVSFQALLIRISSGHESGHYDSSVYSCDEISGLQESSLGNVTEVPAGNGKSGCIGLPDSLFCLFQASSNRLAVQCWALSIPDQFNNRFSNSSELFNFKSVPNHFLQKGLKLKRFEANKPRRYFL